MFYTFDQNNSGGVFKGPADYVIIEAKDANEANLIAEENGLYFDRLDASNQDCACCGHRWTRVDEGEGTETPKIYFRSITSKDNVLIIKKEDNYFDKDYNLN